MILRNGSVAAACAITALGVVASGHPLGLSPATEGIDFNRDIRPILNQNCVSCHGGVRQKNGVSFIYREEALGKGKSGRPTIVPGHPERSELIARLTTTDIEARMPYHAPALAAQQISLLRDWIKEGAKWEEHWAFVAPQLPELPAVKDTGWPKEILDRFVLSALEKQQLEPSPEADRSELLRRVSFDLTGLPPTLAEMTSFALDDTPDSYEKQVDRFLASPHFGERWASMWLDLARYADSKGYEQDGARTSWPYRDWVVDAFNRNIPYDRFVITQLAGDLLPDATFEDRIATAFHRQTPSNDEGGTNDEEFRVAAVLDRASTTWAVVNGVTMNCVQCHSHPYDPIRNEEFYKFLGFFNTSLDDDSQFDDWPALHVPVRTSDYARANQLQKQIQVLSDSVVQQGRDLAAQNDQWVPLNITYAASDKAAGKRRQLALFEREGTGLFAELGPVPEPKKKELLNGFFGGQQNGAEGAGQKPVKATLYELRDGDAYATAGNQSAAAVSDFIATGHGPVVTALRVEILPKNPSTAVLTPEDGFSIERIEAWEVRPNGVEEPISFSYFAPDFNEHLLSQWALVNAKCPEKQTECYPLTPGRTSLARQAKSGGLEATKLTHTRWIIGIPITPRTLTAGSRIKVRLTQNNNMAMVAASVKPTVAPRVRILSSSDPQWTTLGADKSLAAKIKTIESLYSQLAALHTVAVPVMAEEPLNNRRETRQFERGNFLDQIGAPLVADVPALFPKLPADAPRNRLTMARWFFSPDQPLTARVAVNRFWEQLFGSGIVETLEDFGSAGDKPTNPELLDWLAIHFQHDLHWDMKALLRELVLSATYRQTARVTPALQRADPHNSLLAHGPRLRLTAEMLRDQALAASGLLNSRLGGPPVMPPLPPGVEIPMGILEQQWTDAKGPDRYRRALYTHVQRSTPYPTAITFDASGRDVSLARRITTNTPLQALVTLNDPTYVEAAQALARRVVLQSVDHATPSSPLDSRLSLAGRLVLSRNPTPSELEALRTLYRHALSNDASSQRGALPASTLPPHTQNTSATNQRAFTVVANALLNFDAALAR